MRRGAEDERDTGINRKWEIFGTSVTQFLALVPSTRKKTISTFKNQELEVDRASATN